MSVDRIYLNRAVANLEESPEYAPYSKVVIIVGEDENGNQLVYEAGDNSGLTLELTNPWGTEEMAQSILSILSGYQYKPYTATGAILNPAAEIGDAISVDEVYSVIADMETTFSPIMSSTISAPEGSNIDHEYPFESSANRELNRKLNNLSTQFIVENGRIAGIIEQIGNVDAKGSIINQLTTLEQTVNGIHAYTETEIKTIAGSEVENWAAINFTPDEISSMVSNSFDSAGSASAALDAAKDYTDESRGEITADYTSAITQSARQVQSTVGSSIGRYDLTQIPGISASSVVNYGYVSGTAASAPPASEHNGEYYINMADGRVWQSNGTSWIKVHNGLPTVTDELSTRITQTDGKIETEITAREAGDLETRSLISQTAEDIRLEVQGSYADEWTTMGSDNRGWYYPGDIVKITTVIGGVTTGVDFYQVSASTAISASVYPPTSQYWIAISPPSVQSAIRMGLDGISIGYDTSASPNSAYITLSKDGVEIGGGTIVMSNVQANSIAANSYIQSPLIYDANQFGTLKFVAQSSAGQLLYGDSMSSLSTAAFGVSYDPVGGNGSIYVDGVPLASGSPGFNRLFLGSSPSPPTFYCYGTWDFSNATVIMPS